MFYQRQLIVVTIMKLLKFSADWCGPCEQQSKLLEDFDAVPVEEIDVDKNQQRANEYSVRSLPTMVLLNDDTVVKQWPGVTQPDEILSAIEQNS